MKFNSVIATAALGATTVTAAAGAVGESKMERVMALKTKQWEDARAAGLFGGSLLYPSLKKVTPCKKGQAGEYKCNNVNLHSFLSHEDTGSASKVGNDIWGWTAKGGREFGIVGQTDGVAFVELNRLDGSLVYVGRLDTQTEVVSWRDIKVIGDYAYIGSEANGHGLQIFHLNKLLDVKPWWNPWFFKPKTFSKEKDITLYTGFGASHNIVAHEEVNMIYAVGGRSGANARNTTCAGGLFMVDVSDPKNPTSPGCVGIDGYSHDAQCVIYKGPSKQYTGREICFSFNEDTLTVYDMTDKKNVKVVSRTEYEGNAYSHQGWIVDKEMRYLLLDDELDEQDGTNVGEPGRTTTYIFNIADIEKPINTGFFQSPVKSIDHNQYIIDGLSYQANYGSGLRIVDVSSVIEDPTGKSVKETGFFDCHPEDDDVGGVVEFLGTWSVYPYFKSGYILLNSIERGVYSLKYTGRKAERRV
ncbi:hypothetical protein M011DRAFT_492421 [Sporormia fimetaria CBS 119925]|uniref:Regulatory P domain-containing protein n=1 Tax=Sporormia fimetaria CBS 119925 TaxID=1340428 RepID=A0A6A6VHN5_9PLEO|nr:hypothetical protein M011DRAFT_492421 [Sporormia fimetaria CBS 119925]